MSDGKLWRPQAWEAVVDERHRSRLLVANQHILKQLVRKFAASQEEADEMLQDIAVVLLAHRTGPLSTQAFVGWCYGVARNVAAHRRRSKARRRLRCGDAREFDLEAACASMADDPERRAAFRELLEAHARGLDEAGWTLLVDRYFLEETAAEIAARMKVSAASIRMRLARMMASRCQPRECQDFDSNGSRVNQSRSDCPVRVALKPTAVLRHLAPRLNRRGARGLPAPSAAERRR